MPTIGRGRCVLGIGEIFEAFGQDLFLNRQDAVLFIDMNTKLENTKRLPVLTVAFVTKSVIVTSSPECASMKASTHAPVESFWICTT